MGKAVMVGLSCIVPPQLWLHRSCSSGLGSLLASSHKGEEGKPAVKLWQEQHSQNHSPTLEQCA